MAATREPSEGEKGLGSFSMMSGMSRPTVASMPARPCSSAARRWLEGAASEPSARQPAGSQEPESTKSSVARSPAGL
eukprot:1252335-Alexandrium_andersonii.AAC.1